MTVRELIEQLKDVAPDHLVVLSRDEEGNGYGELDDVETGMRFDPEWGQTGYEELTDELRENGYSEDDVMKGGLPCVVLFP
jgi:hypothetical protein